MKDFLQRIQNLPPKKLALLAAQLQERLERSEARTREPVAVVGVGCRFPGGADDPEAFWELLLDGRDAVRDVPAERWDADALYDPDYTAPGKMATRWGGFLDEVDRFDAQLFGISPREAVSMDPQQRLLLETSWQALERAAIAPSSLAGSRTGVFVGVSTADYFQLQLQPGLQNIDAYLASGSAPSVAAGRIAYTLGLQGPTLSVDTACSSSLVALHLAAQALRNGECDAALAGGVNLILSPVTTIALSKAQMMAPDGRCKAFDARADGFVRGEGCGILVLKRLSDARRDGDPIVALIRGSAINQDGRSNGLTAPNGPSQEAVIRAALRSGDLEPGDVGYVEAHGTGTSLGDPIEVQALGAALGAGREKDSRLQIGSVKTNLGHLESAAGVAGAIKTMLVLQHGMIPPHQHLEQPSPVIPWDSVPIDVPTTATPLSGPGRRIAGVSSFGFSGTNAHLLFEAVDAPATSSKAGAQLADRPIELLALSAQSAAALQQTAARHGAFLEREMLPVAEVCHTLNTGRDDHPHRAAFVVDGGEALRDGLQALGRGEAGRALIRGHVETHRPPRPVFLFTGQGAQYPGMGRELYDSEPVYRETLDRCDAFLRERFDVPLLDLLHGEDEGRIHQTAFTQPALFSLELALARLWQSWGVQPGAVLGHSVGEYAAACVAGLFDVEDGLTLIARRGQLMQALPGGGRMVAVFAEAPRVEAAVSSQADAVAIAAYNGPTNIVISGAGDRVQQVLDALGPEVKSRELEVSHPFHSPAMDPILDPFRQTAAGLHFKTPAVPIVSNVFGVTTDWKQLAEPDYWRRHVREPVRFAQAISHLVEQGHELFVELGPQPTLIGMGARCVDDDAIHWLPSLRKGKPSHRQLAQAAATLWSRGVAVDWQAWNGDRPRRRRVLPTYAMQRERFWVQGGADWSRAAQAGSAPAAQVAVEISELLYRVDWKAQPHPALQRLAPAAFFPTVEQVAAAVDRDAQAIADANGLDDYARFLPELDRLGAAYVVAGFRKLGWELRRGERFGFDALVGKLGVVRPHRRLLRRLLEMLTEDGWLRREGEVWVVEREGQAEPERMLDELTPRFGAFNAELTLLGRCGAQLAAVLRGQADPLQVLFPGGSTAETEAVYRDAPMARTFNALVARAVRGLVAGLPTGRRLRVLEVGAGTGGTTASVLPELDGLDVDYLFTDVSAAFTTKARERFADRPWVRFGTLDAGQETGAQGYAPGQFDLILAANVIHATPDLRQTLEGLRPLLAAGGKLVMLEASTRERFADLTVGYTEGWWSFEDLDLRPDYALLDREQWIALLRACGFEAAIAAPTASTDRPLGREVVLVATTPADPSTSSATTPAATSRRFLIVGAGALSDAVAAALSEAGAGVSVHAEAARETLRAMVHGDIDGVVYVDPDPPTAPTSVDEARRQQRRRCEGLLHTVQGLLDAGEALPLTLVTRGAQSVGGESRLSPDGATLWGMGHVIELEHPELSCRRIDLDPQLSAIEAAQMLVGELIEPEAAEPQLALRGGRRLARRMGRSDLAVAPPVEFDGSASYVISGGLRGLGLLVAEWMADRGARHLVLFGRSAADAATEQALARLRDRGVDVAVEQADAASEGDIARVLDRARGLAPLRGIIHNAGTLDDGALLQQRWERFDTVFGPKVWGSVALLRQLESTPLDFVVLFSSGVGLIGSPGQANHAAANAYLDALAHELRRRGQRAVSINWGAWTRVGAAADRAIDGSPDAFTPEQGLAALDRIVAAALQLDGPAQVAVRSADWSAFLDRYPAGEEPSFFRDLFSELRGSSVEPSAASTVGEIDRWAGLRALPARKRRGALRDAIREVAARVLDVDDPSRIEPGQPLHDMGLDSLMAVELRNLLGKSVGAELPATLLFEHPSVSSLVEFLMERHFADAGAPQAQPVTQATSDDEPRAAGDADRPIVSTADADAADADNSDADNSDADDMDTDALADALAARLDRLGGKG